VERLSRTAVFLKLDGRASGVGGDAPCRGQPEAQYWRKFVVQLGDVLKAIGPNASIVFAAWIFMGFLQQRYDNATNRYREAVADYRSNEHKDDRTGNLKDQILLYRRRCLLMQWATLVGLVAAILLIAALIFGALDVVIPKNAIISAAALLPPSSALCL
jgi:hypothetical protein